MPKQKPYKHLSHVPPAHDGMIIFFTVVVYGRRKILNSDLAHETLRGIWDKSGEMNGWFVGDYILMPDHVHFFARAQRDADRMRAWVRMWKSVSARKLMPHLHVSAPFWQEEYFDRYLRSGESYKEKWEYVQANPVRAGLVSHASEWPYQGRVHVLIG